LAGFRGSVGGVAEFVSAVGVDEFVSAVGVDEFVSAVGGVTGFETASGRPLKILIELMEK